MKKKSLKLNQLNISKEKISSLSSAKGGGPYVSDLQGSCVGPDCVDESELFTVCSPECNSKFVVCQASVFPHECKTFNPNECDPHPSINGDCSMRLTDCC